MRGPRHDRPAMSAAQLADRLLDAQVAFVLEELTGPDGAALVASEVRAAVTALDAVPLRDVLDAAAVRTTVREVVAATGPSAGVDAMVGTLVPALRDLPANEDHTLGEVVMWGGVEAVVAVLTRSEQLREEVLHRLSQSPAVSTLSMRFVQALVGDAVQQNRERAERLPGMKSVLGVGDLAARTARGMAPKQLNDVVGGVADRGAQAAMERVSRALVDAFDEDVVREAVMQVWDLHAEDTIAGLRAYLPDEDVEGLAANIHALWLDLHTTPWFGAVLDTAVDGFLDRHSDATIGEVRTELGIDLDLVDAVVERHAADVVAALHEAGELEALVRRRLTPFYRSPATLALLEEG